MSPSPRDLDPKLFEGPRACTIMLGLSSSPAGRSSVTIFAIAFTGASQCAAILPRGSGGVGGERFQRSAVQHASLNAVSGARLRRLCERGRRQCQSSQPRQPRPPLPRAWRVVNASYGRLPNFHGLRFPPPLGRAVKIGYKNLWKYLLFGGEGEEGRLRHRLSPRYRDRPSSRPS